MKIIITAISLLLVSSLAAAFCLNPNDSPSIGDEYADSQSVFIGKIISKKGVPESGGYYEGDEYTVQVQEVLKGNPTNPISIFSENSSGRFPMDVGSTYLIFVYENLSRYQIDYCGNSGKLPGKNNALLHVRKLKQNKKIYHFEPAVVELTGKLIEKDFYGQPGYGEDPKTDSKEPAVIIQLTKPIMVVAEKDDEYNETRDGIEEMQLINIKSIKLTPYLHQKVKLTGKLMSAQTGHHHTDVLIIVDSIDIVK